MHRWLPHLDWRWFKAQLYQESLLSPDAVSPVGAKGLAQFMPATWKEIATLRGYGLASPYEPKYAIDAGAYYMAKLRRGWSSPRPEQDRMDLARASYNAGFGNLLKAQKLCEGESSYDGIIRCLPDITGHHSKETITYNKRIHRWYKEMLLCP